MKNKKKTGITKKENNSLDALDNSLFGSKSNTDKIITRAYTQKTVFGEILRTVDNSEAILFGLFLI
jgi:hypothetical protein